MKSLKKIVFKEQGFTLIEILVSMTILAIIIITFVPIFTQAAIHNKVNGNKLKTNEAAQVVASNYQRLSDLGLQTARLPSCPETIDESLNGKEEIGDRNYSVKVNLCKFDTDHIDGLVLAVFTTQSIGQKPATTGVARKFLMEADSNVQNP